MTATATARLLFCLLTVVLLPALSCRAETRALNLEDCIAIAMAHNPRIDIARQQFFANEGIVTQARSRYWPHLAAGAGYGRFYYERASPTDEGNVTSALLSASQLIYDFGRTTGLVEATSFNRSASAENMIQEYQDLIYRVKSSFYRVLETERLIGVAEEAVGNYQRQLERAQSFYRAGVRTRIDVTNAEVNLANQKLGLLRARADYRAARVALEKELGQIPNDGDYRAVSAEPPLDQLATGKPAMPGPLDDLLQTAYQNRPGLKEFNLLIQAAEASVRQTEGDYWPVLDAVGSYATFESDVSNLENLSDQWQLTARLSWEFFSGFETEGKMAEANASLREVQAGLRDFELQVTNEVTESYLRADENREGVDIADQTLELARENLRLAEGRYKAGIGDILEFNDAQLLLTENQTSLVVSYYDYLTALARIERAIGVTPELAGYDLTARR